LLKNVRGIARQDKYKFRNNEGIMKIGFFGTPDIAAYSLSHLSRTHNIVFAVTREDKPQGRSLQIAPSPVKVLAEKMSIPVLQFSSLKDELLPTMLSSFGADIFVVVAYGKIIPESIFNIPRLGSINLHPSLLPKYRGAAPVESAVIAGESETGVSVQIINERLDAGAILGTATVIIPPEMTSGELYDIMFPVGAELLSRIISGLEAGTVVPVPQIEEMATYCGKITKESACIDWEQSTIMIGNCVRGYNPKPVAWTCFRDSTIKIWRCGPISLERRKLMPGELMVYQKRRLVAGTGDGMVEILSVQPETKKMMPVADFINGYRIKAGEYFRKDPPPDGGK
jgi:methionyl-tRNA formyltransferase